MTTKRQPNLFERLFSRAIIQDSGCWEYDGCRCRDGYGMIWNRGTMIGAHRAAYDLCIGDIPIDMKVLHTCDNPACVNPSHLWLGTDQDNANDKVIKGRQGCLRGSQLSHAKLNEIQVIEIKELIAKQYSQREIARMYDVSQGTIAAINQGRLWRHVI